MLSINENRNSIDVVNINAIFWLIAMLFLCFAPQDGTRWQIVYSFINYIKHLFVPKSGFDI